jgi:hypothetical protein
LIPALQVYFTDQMQGLIVFAGDGLSLDAGFIGCDVVGGNKQERRYTTQTPVFPGGKGRTD